MVLDDISNVRAVDPPDRAVIRYDLTNKRWRVGSLGGLLADEFFNRDETAETVQERFDQIATNASDLITQADSLTQQANDIAQNAQDLVDEISNRISGDDGLQQQINALAVDATGSVYIQNTEPVPGVGGVDDPIVDNARWYDSTGGANTPYIWQPRSLVNSTYQWTATGNTGEYYVELSGGGDPGLAQPQQIEVNDTSYLTSGTPPLAASEWAWGNGGGGFNTVIVRLSDDADPDSKTDGFVELYDWWSLEDPRIGANASAIDALETTVDDPDTGVSANASAIGTLETTVYHVDTGVAANAAAIDSLESTVNDPDTGVSANASAIGVLETTVNDADTGVAANAQAITELESTVNDPQTGVGANASAIGELETTVKDA